MFWKKEREIHQAVDLYVAVTEQCLAAFKQAWDVYFASGLSSELEKLVDEVHRLEGQADAKRREIEDAMYGRSLIPDARADILALLEAVDLVPNKAESVLFQLWLESIRIPEEFSGDLKALLAANIESHAMLCRAVRCLFSEPLKAAAMVNDICEKEKAGDHIERKLIKAVFDSSLDKADKLILKDLLLQIGDISDRTENAGDRLRIIAVKRPM